MKLLTRTVRNYIVFATLLLFICTPIFYFAIRQLFIHEMDKVLLAHKNDFLESAQFLKTEADLKYYHMMNKEFILTLSKTPTQKDSLFTAEVYDSVQKKVIPYRTFRTGVIINQKSYDLQVVESMVSTSDLVIAIVSIQSGLLAVLLVGLVFINRKLSRIIWDPFYKILDRLKQYEIDRDTSIELPRSSTAEFRDLSKAVTQLVNKNHDAYVSQKEFTENASHEMQTPLAVLNGKLDLLMQTELNEHQAELISAIHASTSRLARLNRSLLLLAKIENDQFHEQEEVDVELLLVNQIKQYEDLIHQKEIAISKQGDVSPVLLTTNKALFEILVSNLLLNAIRYAPSSTNVVIHVSFNFFIISNQGKPLKNPQLLFERFQREHKQSSGSGLGLSIVRKICDNLNYSIRYEFLDHSHQFTVKFTE